MERNKKIITTSIKGIIVNIILVIFKIAVGLISKSIAIVLDGVNNLTDAISSIVTIIGTAIAGKKPDKEHPYGHGRVEYFASIIISIIILYAGVSAFRESVQTIINPAQISYSAVTLVVVIVSIFVKIVLGQYFKKVGNDINSDNLVSSGKDALFDSILSTATLVAAILNILLNWNLEGYLGIVISLFIIKASIEIFKETIDNLIGVRIESELATDLKQKIISYDNVEGAYDLILHNYGPLNMMGSVHIQVPDTLNAKQIHKLTRTIETDIYKEYGIILTMGIYASNTTDKEAMEIRKDLDDVIKDFPYILQIHAFYVDAEKKEITFDMVVSFDDEDPNKTREDVIDKMKSKHPKYKYNVIIDNDFSD